MTAVPAFGRDYKTKKEVLAAWAEGKDFIVRDMFNAWDGRLFNKDSLEKGTRVGIRYKKLTQQVFVTV